MRSVSAAEGAELLGISVKWFHRLLAAGRVRGAKRIGARTWLVPLGRDGLPRVAPPPTNLGPRENRWRP